jgi:hypothetical protein
MCAYFLLLFMATHGTASVAEPEEFPFGFFIQRFSINELACCVREVSCVHGVTLVFRERDASYVPYRLCLCYGKMAPCSMHSKQEGSEGSKSN